MTYNTTSDHAESSVNPVNPPRNFRTCFENSPAILMEGALGERLKREYGIIFDEHIDMGALAYSITGRKALEALWTEYAEIAYEHDLPFICTTPTRRSNRERIAQTRYGAGLIRQNVDFLRKVQSRLQKRMEESAQDRIKGSLQDRMEGSMQGGMEGLQQENMSKNLSEHLPKNRKFEVYIGALLGCRGDAYTGKEALGLEEAREFHSWEAGLFAEAGVDFFYAALMPALDEACGMALALAPYDIPYIISFTITRSGHLIDGHTIAESIEYIDHKIEEIYGTGRKPICYMTNCVHPDIVYAALKQPFNETAAVGRRFLGIQANTSALDYADLDGSIELKTSGQQELAEAMIRLNEIHPFKIWGGCCGTDGSHMRAIAERISRM